MGVHGLQQYIDSNIDFLMTCCFRQSKLIIDGSCLFHWLYFESNLDQIHGGNYNDFEKTVTLYNLGACNIEPYVVLDGGDDIKGNKFETMKRRCQERIRRANALSRGCSGEHLPILIKNVFKQILQKIGVHFIQCLTEADWEAAALANEWGCPILSSDSDFYIFSNRGGFLPITYFKWRKGSHHKCIPAKLFRFENLCAAFNHMNRHNLSLFAIIQGNDYYNLDKRQFPNFSQFSTRLGKTSKIDGLLTWLSHFTGPTEAISSLMSQMKKDVKSDSLRHNINQAMEMYRLKPSSIAQFFINGEPQSRPLQNLPDWTLKPLAEGKLASSIIAVLTQKRVILKFQVEDFGLSSSNHTSQLIRQVMYGILLCTRRQNIIKCSTSDEENQQYDVEEYDRQKTTLISSMVPAVLPRCVETQLHLDSLWEAPQDVRLQVMLEALEVSQIADSTVPEGLQLAVYVTCFWLKHAKPKPRAEIFWALLVSLVYGYLCREPKTEEVEVLSLEFEKLYRCNSSRAMDLKLAHAYCQWHCCLKDSFTLNQLLNHPVPEPELASLYCGSLLHGAAHELKRGRDPESVLTGSSVAISLYQSLHAAVVCELDDDFITKMQTRTRECQKSVDKLSNAFEHLMDEDEEENVACRENVDDKLP
ncbi:protein asteroid-like 1 [Silurus meridionalis]|nr:protein asteroid-like 1 [Silurus meridionalis]